jgi:hypothetical protein
MGPAANSTPLCAKAIMYSRCAGNTGKSLSIPTLLVKVTMNSFVRSILPVSLTGWRREEKLRAVSSRRPDCLAGHVRFELANPRAGHLIGFA